MEKIIIFSLFLITAFLLAVLTIFFAFPNQTTAEFFTGMAPFGGRIVVANVPPAIECGGNTEVFSIKPTGPTTPAGPYVITGSTKRYGIWSQTFGVPPLPPRAIKGIYSLFPVPCFTNTTPPAPAGYAFPVILFATSLF